jgi:hypothetical protein
VFLDWTRVLPHVRQREPLTSKRCAGLLQETPALEMRSRASRHRFRGSWAWPEGRSDASRPDGSRPDVSRAKTASGERRLGSQKLDPHQAIGWQVSEGRAAHSGTVKAEA